jgi:hypothetical protein
MCVVSSTRACQVPLFAWHIGARTTIEMTIRPDGMIEGRSSAILSGVFESEIRANRFSLQSSAEQDVVKAILQRFNETGSGSLEYPDPRELNKPFWVKTQFRRDPVTNFPGPGALITPVGLSTGGIFGFGAFKPVAQRLWPWDCYSRVLEDNYQIDFPRTAAVGRLPKGVMYKEAGIQYHSPYKGWSSRFGSSNA